MRQHSVLVTNIPAPYREEVHRLVAEYFGGNHTVIYCQEREPNRIWKLAERHYPAITLQGWMATYRGRYIHCNPDIVAELNRLDPDVVITTGFTPTMLLAFGWAVARQRRHIAMTDGWAFSETVLSPLHRALRKLVFRFSSAFIGASRHSLDLYRSYHCNEAALFQSHLCANNDLFFAQVGADKEYELLFSGQFVEGKLPLFFAEVAAAVKKLHGRCRVLLLGDGPLREPLLQKLYSEGVEVTHPGYLAQDQLPAWYAKAKILLFPTRQDAWGVVVNEAMAAGLPVITCENAGVAHDLVQNGINGYVLPLDALLWAGQAVKMLEDETLYRYLSQQALVAVEPYHYRNAAQGIIRAVEYARQGGNP